MDSNQRLQALTRAYADVILNTSNEAAVRVMAAERRAQQLEHELRATRDEAVQMMARHKKKMDDKISEANMNSRNQQEKIDELEAQLHEAEDIVTELREQLRYEQAKFDKLTRSVMKPLDKHDTATPEEAFEENRQSQSIPCPPSEFQKDSLVASKKDNPYLNQRTEYPLFSSKPQMGSLYGTMPELPSIILRSKTHKQYRNACTQRIHACERNILDSELSLSKQPDDASSKGKVNEEKRDITMCRVNFNEIHKMLNIQSKEAVNKNVSISCSNEVRPVKFVPREAKTAARYGKDNTTETDINDKEGDTEKIVSKGEPPVKTATKHRKIESTSGKKNPDKLLLKKHETRGVPHSDPSPKSVEDNSQPNEDPAATKRKLSSDIAGMMRQPGCAETLFNVKEGDTEELISKGEPPVKPFTKHRMNKSTSDKNVPDMKRHETPGVPHSDPGPKSVEKNLRPCEDPTPMTPKLSSDIAGLKTQSECGKNTETSDKKGDTGKLISKGEPAVNTLATSVQEGASKECSDIQVSDSNLKRVDKPVPQFKPRTTDAISKGSSLQLFPYTFQRKRKIETLSTSDGNISTDNDTPERRKETQKTSEVLGKSSVVADSSLEGRW